MVDELQRKTIQAKDELDMEMSRSHKDLTTKFMESGSVGFGDAPNQIKEIYNCTSG
jgi:hypothetical protein